MWMEPIAKAVGFLFVLWWVQLQVYFRFMEMVKYTKDNLFIKIKASYVEEGFQLTPSEEEKKKLLEKIYALRIDDKHSKRKTIEIMMRDFEVPMATAYRDYNLSMAIFGDVDRLDKAVERIILSERYMDIAKRAKKAQNLEAELKAIIAYEKVLGVDVAESLVDTLKHKSVEVTIKLDKRQKKAVDKFFQLGVADYNDFDAEDVQYQEVNDESEEDED